MNMFSKRRQQQSRPSDPGEDKAPEQAAEDPAEAAPREAAAEPPSRPAARPDASAVLNRQPTPPVRPDMARRAMPGAAAQAQAASRPAEPAAARHLKVGRDIEISGTIRSCERLVVEGNVEADLSDSKTLEITASGSFKGSAEVDVAEIAGRFEGELTVRERLSVRAGGRVQGTVRYRALQIESGGRIGGTLLELDDADDAATVGQTREAPKLSFTNGATRSRDADGPTSTPGEPADESRRGSVED